MTYDFEAKSSYSVTIKADDGKGGTDTVAVTITLTDVNEPPAAPAAPTVAATSGTTTSLDVSWTAPSATDRPAVASYDVRYCAGSAADCDADSDFTDGPQNVTTTSSTITGLTAGTTYQVQVRATNAEGDSDWSSSGSASTGTAPLVDTACPTPDLADRETVWSATLSADHYYGAHPENGDETYGYGFDRHLGWGSLSEETFALDGESYSIELAMLYTDGDDDPTNDDEHGLGLFIYGTGDLVLGLSRKLPATAKEALRLHVCDAAFDLGEAAVVEFDTGSNGTVFDHVWRATTLDWSSEPELELHLSRPLRSSRATAEPVVVGAPTFSDAGSDGAWTQGETVEVTLTFSEAVTVHTADGTPAVALRLGGTVQKTAAYLRGSGTAELVFGYKLVEADGLHTSMLLPSNSLALNGGAIRSLASDADAALDHAGAAKTAPPAEVGGQGARDDEDAHGRPGPAAPFEGTFSQVPPEHDGKTAFELQFHLSAVPGSLSFVTVRDSLFEVTGGSIGSAWRQVKGRDQGWGIRVEPAGVDPVTVALVETSDCGTPPGVCTASGRMLGGGTRAVVHGPASLSVADTEVDENEEDAKLAFVVTLSRARGAESSVDYATADDTATAGSDYTAASGTLTFAAGETKKTVEVAVLGDAHDEGEETVTFTLSNATPSAYVRIDDGEATGTIVNDDAMPRAWLARFGRTVGTQVLDALGGRLDGAGGAGSSHVTVGGIPLTGAWQAPEEEETEHTDPFALPEWATRAREAEARTLTMEELILGSAFTLSAGAEDGEGPAYTAWGRVAREGFSAEVEEPGRERLALDGEVTTGFVGVDAEWERLIAGVLLSQSRGEGTYLSVTGTGTGGDGAGMSRSTTDTDSGGDGDGSAGTHRSTTGTGSGGDGRGGGGGGGEGTVDSTLTGVYPYARLALGPRVSAWVVAGAGTGELRLRPADSEMLETGMSLTLGALGLEGQVLDGTGAGGVSLDVRSDALWVRTRSDAVTDPRAGRLASAEGDVTRLRLLLRTERAFSFEGGATFTPSGEVGLRHDGGDAETGTGVELGLGLRYGAGALTAQGRFRALVAHEADGYEEWGASASVRYGAGESGRGLTLELAPEWGRTGSAAEQLWSARAAGDLVAGDGFEAPGRLRADLGYGFGLGDGLGDGLGGRDSVLTPYTGLVLGDGGSRQWRFGVRWQLGAHATAGLEATRDAGAGGAEPADAFALRIAVRF